MSRRQFEEAVAMLPDLCWVELLRDACSLAHKTLRIPPANPVNFNPPAARPPTDWLLR